MYEIKINPTKNRLYLLFGEMNRDELIMVIQDIERECQKLISGFDCITVFQEGKIITHLDEDLLCMVQEVVFRYGIRRVVRVVGKAEDLGRRQLERLAIQAEYPVEYAETTEDAERMLDTPRE